MTKRKKHNIAVGIGGVVGASMLNPYDPLYGIPIRKYVYGPITKNVPKEQPLAVSRDLTAKARQVADKLGLTFNVSKKRHPQGGSYNPVTKTVETSLRSPGISFHELGHAKIHKKLKHLAKVRTLGIGMAPLAVLGAAVTDKDSTVSKIMPAAAALGVAPMLADEAVASFSAIKDLRKLKVPGKVLRRSIRNLSTGFGTYALAAATAVAAPALLRKFKKSKTTKKS